MGVTKKIAYEERVLDFADTARGLAHPARITILEYLRDHPSGSNTAFRGLTQLSQASVSRHIRVMEKAGLVETDYLPEGGVSRLGKHADELIFSLFEKCFPENGEKTMR